MTAARESDRRAELARIHILAKELALSRDEYEDLVFSLTRARSAGDLDSAGRQQLIGHLAELARRYENDWIERAAPDRQPLLRKIVKLAGSRGKKYAEGISAHMFGIERLQLCAPDQLRSIVVALVKDQQRRAAKAS